jgi:hypothetical protein
MLFTDTLPEHIVIGQSPPLARDLCSSSKGYGVQIGENTKRDFGGEYGEWIDANDIMELLREE